MSHFPLRPYQESAENDVRDAMRQKRAVLLVLATGGGKTVIFSDVSRKAAARGKNVLILAHRDTLIRQASAKLDDYDVSHGIIMAGRTPAYHQRVQVASVQTIVRRLDRLSHLKFDLIIVDEAHLSAAKSYQRVIEHWPDAKVLGVTGSPIRLDGKGLGREFGGLFDILVAGISIRELIAQAYLVRPVVFASREKLDTSQIKKIGGDFDSAELAEVMDKPRITGNAIDEYRRVCPGVPGVAWCVNVKHAQHVAAEFNAAGIPAVALSGDDDADERAQALDALARGKVKIITFAMLLVEGVDCPVIGAVILLRPTMSLASYLQVIGRGLRPVYAPGMPLDTVEQRLAAIDAGPKGRRCVVLDHADLWSRHGFADDEREWTLEGAKKKAKGKKKETEPNIYDQCPKCYVVHLKAPTCPECGHVYETKARELEHVDGELQEITDEMRLAMRRETLRAQGAAQSVEDLIALGYSRGRAEHVVAAREEKSQAQAALRDDMVVWQKTTGKKVFDVFGVYVSDIKKIKPKDLKTLREKFDRHVASESTGIIDLPGDDVSFGDFMRQTMAG